MQFSYQPQGTCSYEMIIELNENRIKKVLIKGGCAGNLLGISHLVKGMSIEEAIQKLKGIPCGNKGTSCPDQLAIALEQAKEKYQS